jgi:hypothetical protein
VLLGRVSGSLFERFNKFAARHIFGELHRSTQPKSQALQMDQISQPNPGFGETLLPQKRSRHYAANFRFT